MTFNSVVTNPGRLRILAALHREPQQDFVRLRSQTQLTDGNLCTHARRLSTAGMIEIHKQIRGGKPITQFLLTTSGRQALEDHARSLAELLQPAAEIETVETSIADESDWVD
jgi:DNA-binding MarR family transcriptional regulator